MATALLDPIREAAMKYPGAEKAFLFGDHEVYRVNEKVFVWLGEREGGGYGISVKLKDSQQAALMLPFCKPAAYGMAKWGWVDVEFPKGKAMPMELISQWLDESYRHTAPKKLLKQLGESAGAAKPSSAGKVATKAAPKAAAKKAPARQTKARSTKASASKRG